jgi:hypothetical protein
MQFYSRVDSRREGAFPTATRREFLQSSAAALAVTAARPIIGWQSAVRSRARGDEENRVLGWDPVGRKSKAI